MYTHIGENGAVVTGLILVLLVRRSSEYLVPVLLVLAIRSLQLEDLYLTRGGVQTRSSRQPGLHLDPKWNAFLATVLLRRKFGTYTIDLSTEEAHLSNTSLNEHEGDQSRVTVTRG